MGAKPRCYLQTADSVVAEYQQSRFVRQSLQFLQFRGDGLHGDKACTVDARQRKFLRFPHINQDSIAG